MKGIETNTVSALLEILTDKRELKLQRYADSVLGCFHLLLSMPKYSTLFRKQFDMPRR